MGLYEPDLIAWLKETQPESWEVLQKNHGEQASRMIGERIRKNLDTRGTLDVLRRGIEMIGLRQPLVLAQFKPAFGLNDSIISRYAANRLRVVRQVHHSLNAPNESMDLVFFLNGIPVATSELKSDFTQSVQDAIDQYRYDRSPTGKGKLAEPLLTFPGGALVHFAVSQNEVMMATKLEGLETRFLPFNKGCEGGAGNPVNPEGNRTAYLWEEIWQKDSWLEIIGRYLISQYDEKKKLKSVIFPRYHQLDGTRKLVADVYAKGAGERYLIQHSAGSGKTNSIAWSAHFLADLHDRENQKIFDSVLVVSDRNVLDAQLSEAIFDFERTAGVVATISGSHGSKTKELLEALETGKKIIVCTIQTFPYALKAVQELSATEGKRFAVIADEAHSSQTGDAAAKLKELLSAEELAELEDGGEISNEDILLAANMSARVGASKISYVAFTATPKAKTIELFGTKDEKGEPAPFHVYSMRQAIEEGFILDVLKNYTPYSLAFQLANEAGEVINDQDVEKNKALKTLMNWVRLHPYNIASKVQIVVEHFRSNVESLLEGKAKAMIVVGSRKEAVRWQKAIMTYIAEKRYSLGVLVAFSGEVTDLDSFPEGVSENSKELNPDLKGRDIRKAFNGDEYQLLLVANKFQTGFDQPLLCGMYVDKRLNGIQAVQTLSRLNRSYPGKDTTYILDFVNKPEEIWKSFKAYYETAEISGATDPNKVFELRAKLDALGYYDGFEVERVIKVELDLKSKQSDLVRALEPVIDRLLKQYKRAQKDKEFANGRKDEAGAQIANNIMDSLQLFKSDMVSFNRLYSFLSQIFDYGNTDIEKRFIFYKRLIPLLEFGRERDIIDISKVILTHHTIKSRGKQSLNLGEGDKIQLPPIDAVGTGSVKDIEKVKLDEIIQKVNSLFQGEVSDDDQLLYVNQVLRGKILENKTLVQQASSNTKEQFSNSPDLTNALLKAIMDAFEAHTTMSTQALESKRIQEGLKDLMLGPIGIYESLRERGEQLQESEWG